MSTMQDSWREFRDAVYPHEISALQNEESHAAFIAGAAVYGELLTKLSALPEEEAITELSKLNSELKALLQARADVLKGRVKT